MLVKIISNLINLHKYENIKSFFFWNAVKHLCIICQCIKNVIDPLTATQNQFNLNMTIQFGYVTCF